MRAILIPELCCEKKEFNTIQYQITFPYAVGPKSPILVGQGACRIYPKFGEGKSNIRLTLPLSGVRNGTHKDIKSPSFLKFATPKYKIS